MLTVPKDFHIQDGKSQNIHKCKEKRGNLRGYYKGEWLRDFAFEHYLMISPLIY